MPGAEAPSPPCSIIRRPEPAARCSSWPIGSRRTTWPGGALAAAEPVAQPVRVLGLAGLGVLALGLAAFGSAGPVHGPAAALWHPRRAWEATVAPVRVSAEQDIVDRGDSTSLRLEAFGRRHATLWLRAPGEGWRPRGVSLDSLGRAQVTTGALQSDLYARVTSGTRAPTPCSSESACRSFWAA